jgi:hypothetical protein
VQVKHVGRSRQKDYLEDEMRLRARQDAFDARELGDLQTVGVSQEQFDRLREAAEEGR